MESSSGSGPHVLVIDDEPTIRDLICDVLGDEGYRTSRYVGPFDDAAVVAQLRPDLVILDIVLGDQWTGLAFLEILKDDPRTTRIPILVCTASAHLTNEIEKQLTTRDCVAIAKPFDLEELLGEISRCLAALEPEPLSA